MCKKIIESFGKNWFFVITLQLLLCSALFSSEKNDIHGGTGWIDQLDLNLPDVPDRVVSLDQLIHLSLLRNSAIRGHYAAWKGSTEAELAISRLPDPILGMGYFIEPVETAQGPQSAKITLGQTIPWFSKISASRATTKYQSVQRMKALEESRLSLIRELTSLWIETGYLHSKTSLVEAKIALSRDLEEILNIQYQSASISHKKLVDVQIETLQLENDLRDMESEFDRLNAKLGSILEIEAPLPADFLPNNTVQYLSEGYVGGVSSEHPRLQGLEAMIDESQSRMASARAAFVPDVNLGIDYILTDKRTANGVEVGGSGKDPLMVSVGIAMPLWNWKSNKAEVKSSEWLAKKAEALLLVESSRLAQDYEISQSRFDEDVRFIKLYEDQLIPKAREIEKVMQQEYIGQSSDVYSYTMARLQVLDLELELTRAKYSAQLHLADLRYLRGK